MRLKEVLLFIQAHHFDHPWEWILSRWVELPEDEHNARHSVVGLTNFQFGGFCNHVQHFLLELCRPQVRVFNLDRVHDVDAEVHVHGFIAHDVFDLLSKADHLVALHEAEDLY